MLPILNIYKYATLGLAAALAGSLTVNAVQHSAKQRLALKFSQAETRWQAEKKEQAEAHARKLAELKGSYETLVQTQSDLYTKAADKATKLEQAVAKSDIVAIRLRDALKTAVTPTYIATTNSSTPVVSPTTIKAGDMCAVMFRRIDEAATGIGAFAERAYAAAETCAGSYDAAERSLKSLTMP